MIEDEKHSKPMIGLVCYANYCRSPVAELLLKERFNNEFEFYSAGINPIYKGSIDPRSLTFLKDEGIKQKIHTPRKITLDMIKSSKIIFGLDFSILDYLNKNFQRYSDKFRIFSSKKFFFEISDPYHLDDKAYRDSMNYIKKIVSEIKI